MQRFKEFACGNRVWLDEEAEAPDECPICGEENGNTFRGTTF